MKEFTRPRVAEQAADGTPLALRGALSRLDRIPVLAAVLALGLTFVLAFEPGRNWLLLLLFGLSALAADGIVRTHPKARFERIEDTALFLFVPVLFTLSVGVFLKDVADSSWTIGAGVLSIFPYWAILRAEYECIDRESEYFQIARLVLNVATYIIAFLVFRTIFDFDLGLLTSAFAAGVVSLLLAIEVLREEALNTGRTILYALAIGLLLAESAWATHFLPLEGSGAAVFLLLAFYLMTGMMHNYLANRLNMKTASEFSVVALAGVAIIAVSTAY